MPVVPAFGRLYPVTFDKMMPVFHIGLLLLVCSYIVIAQLSLKVTPVDDTPKGSDLWPKCPSLVES